VSNLVKRLQEARKAGGGLPVEAWDKGNATLLAKGTLQSLDNQIDTTSGTIKLKAQLSNNEGLLFPNQFVNIRLLSDTLHDATVVPSAAIQHGSAGAFVYLITKDDKRGEDKGAANKPASDKVLTDKIPDGKVAGDKEPGDKRPAEKVVVQPVKTGAADGDLVAIESGVQPGDRVVVSGIDKLRDGAKVIVSSGKDERDGGGRRSGKRGNGVEKSSAADGTATGDARPHRRHRSESAAGDPHTDGATDHSGQPTQRSDATAPDNASKSADAPPSPEASTEEGAPRRHRGDWAGKQGDGTPREGGWKRRRAEPADGAPVPAASSSQ
jgi:multidrug efflux system membrane fusion protein